VYFRGYGHKLANFIPSLNTAVLILREIPCLAVRQVLPSDDPHPTLDLEEAQEGNLTLENTSSTATASIFFYILAMSVMKGVISDRKPSRALSIPVNCRGSRTWVICKAKGKGPGGKFSRLKLLPALLKEEKGFGVLLTVGLTSVTQIAKKVCYLKF